MKKLSLLTAIVMAVGMFNGSYIKVKADVNKDIITNIKANTYVGDDGIMVDSFELTVADEKKIQELTAEDFDIVGNANSSMSIHDYEDDGIELQIDGNKLIIDVKDFRYDGTQTIKVRPNEEGENTNLIYRLEAIDKVKRDFEVICKKDKELSFGYSDITEKVTKTIDKFVSGEYTSKTNGESLRYDMYMPNSNTKVPLVVWLHGGGEVLSSSEEGANIWANRGATTWIESGYETAVISFQYPENYKYAIYADDEESKKQLALMEDYFDLQYEFIQELINEGKVDSSRIYVVGASSGGGGAVRFLMQYPELFAAAIPIATKDTIEYAESTYSPTFKPEPSIDGQVELYKEKLKGLEDIPIWFVHAIDDPICNPVVSSLSYQALQELGSSKVKLTMYSTEEMGGEFGIDETGLNPHASWINALNDKEMISWLFNQVKTNTNDTVEKVEIEKVVANCTVENFGETLNSIDVTLSENIDSSKVKAEDFTIKNAIIDHLGTVGDIKVNEIKVNGNTLTLNVDKFLFFKSTDLEITCVSNPEISFKYSDMIVSSPVADKFEDKEYNGLKYKLFSPKTNDKLPLVIWMHGRGDNGYQLRTAKNATMFAEDENQAKNPCYVMAAQSDESVTEIRWTDRELENIIEVVNQLIEDGKVDENRVYIVGHSMGGQGTWNLLRKAPKLFAAAITMAPRVIEDKKELDDLEALKDLPVWLFHATSDPINKVDGSRDRYNKLLEVGNTKVKYTELSDDEMKSFGIGYLSPYEFHATNVVMANTPGVIDWLFEQVKTSTNDIEEKPSIDNEKEEVIQEDNTNKEENNNTEKLPNTGAPIASDIFAMMSMATIGSGLLLIKKKK